MSPSKWDDDRDTFGSSLGRHGSIFDNRPSLLDDGGFFDRKGSLFDSEKSILAANSETSGVSRVEYDANNYKIHVNVQNFKPEELVVKTVDNNTVQVQISLRGFNVSTQLFVLKFHLFSHLACR